MSLAYHSIGTIRGKDLATVLRYGNPYTAKQKVAGLKTKLPY